VNFFEPDEEQRALCNAVREFGRSLNEGLARRDAEATFDRAAWRRCAEFGIPGLPLPREYGGSGADLMTTLLAMMALGQGCRDNGLVFSLNAQMWAFQLPVLKFGTEAQRQRYLPPLARGERIGAHAVTEPAHGSDAMGMRTRARRDGDHYVLDGSKTFVTNGPVADVLLVFATVNPALKSLGVTGFLVDRETPGLTLSRPIPKMGIRTSPMGEVVLEGCRVPVSARLGPEGAGASIFNAAMAWERTCIFAGHLGAMERLLEDCVAYAKAREQFGQPIARHPEIADKLVDMKVSIEAGRLMLYRAAAVRGAGGDGLLEAAMAKLFVSEAHVRQALAAIQIHGGYGFTTEYGVERELRDAVPGTLYSGTTEMQRKIIARLMGLS
jgi:alkylation response protein AidB-like acyl-CoA dehydrogenase